MKINEIETSTNPSISTNIGSTNHWGVTLTFNETYHDKSEIIGL